MRTQADDTRAVAAALTDRAELVSQQDAQVVRSITQLREQLASPMLTAAERYEARGLLDELEASVGPRLEAAARAAGTVGQVIEHIAAEPAKWLSVLRAEVADLESIASALRVTIAILELAPGGQR